MDISYEYYRVFYYVARHKSITRAAELLQRSQPNLTRVIKSLEEQLGCSLLVRNHRGVALTPEGAALYEHVKVAVESLQAGQDALCRSRSLESGVLALSAGEVALRCLLLPVLKQYRSRYPGVQLKIFHHSTPQGLRALGGHLVDFAVVTTPLELPAHLQMQPLRRYRERAVCGAAYRAALAHPLTLADLTRYPLIGLGSDTVTHTFYAELFRRHGLSMTPDIEAATADLILPMVANDLGIGFVPEDFLQGPAAQGVTPLTLREQIPARDICLVTHRGAPLSLAAQKLVEMLIQASDAPAGGGA